MAEVAIDIDAMQHLVTAIDGAIEDMPAATGQLRANLYGVGLSSPALDRCAWDGEVATWLSSSSRDLNRRLSMARMIQRSTPSLSVVHFDDSHLSTASDAEIKARVARVRELLGNDDSDRIDPELLKLLQDNALDPYFAKEMASQVSPEVLDGYLHNMLAGYWKVPHADPSGEQPDENAPPTSWELLSRDYQELDEALGITFGLASQGKGSLAVPGMAKQWADYIRSLGDDTSPTPTPSPQPGGQTPPPDGGVIRLTMVIGQGQWSDDFLVDTYHAVRDSEGGRGSGAWNSDGFFLDDDPMRGMMTALQLNPGAVRRIFATGPRETITVRGEERVVNSEMYAFLQREGSAAPEFIKALQAAIASPPVEGGRAWQPELAADVKVLADWVDEKVEEAEQAQQEAEEEAGPLWKRIGHALFDLAGLVPVLGEAFDAINGAWYYADGDVINGSLSMASVIPFVGWGFQGGKWVRIGLKAEELAKLTRLAEEGRAARIFLKDGRLTSKEIDLADPDNFRPERFLSDRELALWSGPRSFMQRVIAGNRFNAFANAPYGRLTEITLTRGKVRGFRLDAYAPPNEIVSRKLTQLGVVQPGTAKGYIDEFVRKYPPGSKIADTPKNRELGIAGTRLRGKMVLEVPPQYGGKLPREIVEYAETHRVFIRDVNGHWYTTPPKGS